MAMRNATPAELEEIQALCRLITALTETLASSETVKASVYYSLFLQVMIDAVMHGQFEGVMAHFRANHSRYGKILEAQTPQELLQIMEVVLTAPDDVMRVQ